MTKKLLLAVFSIILLFSELMTIPIAHAAFNPNNIMNDAVFDNVGSMSAIDIQNFLNQFPTSCLKNYTAPYPNDYFSYGGNVSAASVIRRVADLWAINPQVLLATLQKESSVVTGTASYGCAYMNTAMGFNCPDAGACPVDPANGGFSQQVTKGGWLLKAAEERSLGNINWDPPQDPDNDRNYYYSGPMTQGYHQRRYDAPVQYFDGLNTIDSQSVSMGTGSTASFYFYTPHFSGNQHLVTLFEGWFGSTQTVIPYAWSYEGQEAYSDAARTKPFTSEVTTMPGKTIYMRVKARNIGNQTWSQSVVHLGTSRPHDRTSVFKDGSWLNNARAASLVETSVQPNEVGTFEFSMTAPTTPGTYPEYFNLVADGVTWLNDPGQYFVVNVVPRTVTSNTTNTGLSPGASLKPRDNLLSPDAQSTLVVQPDGNLVLYGNFENQWNSKTTGQFIDQLVMQGDGNLVLYNTIGQAVWNSGTNGNPGAHLVLQTDGNVVVYSATNVALWATSTIQNPDHLEYVNLTLQPTRLLYAGQSLDTADRRFRMVLQRDGNLVLYSPSRAIWSSATAGTPAAYAAMQSDGNLVLYDKTGRALWQSGTAGRGLSYLALQSDGNLVLYNGIGIPTWSSMTAGKL